MEPEIAVTVGSAEDNPELKAMYSEDQADRSPAPAKTIDWRVVAPRDRVRESKVKELYRTNQLVTGGDYYHAAMILQHAERPDDYLLAHEFCVAAICKGEKRAIWLSAAAEDRFLLSIGRSQRFGTQFVSDHGGAVQLEKMDDGVNDALRQVLSVPALAEAQQRETAASARATAITPPATKKAASRVIDRSILGRWSGVGPDHLKIDCRFTADGKFSWAVGKNPVIIGEFEAKSDAGILDVDMFNLEPPEFEKFRLLGIAKIEGDKMTMVCARSTGEEPPTAPVLRPTKFDEDTLTFTREKRWLRFPLFSHP